MAATTAPAGATKPRSSRPGATRTRPGGPDTTSRRPSSSDVKSMRARASHADRAYSDAFEAGKADAEDRSPNRSRPPEPHLQDAYDEGVTEALRRQADTDTKTKSSPSSPGGSRSFDVTGEGAGLILGVVAYALVLNYLAYGWPGVTGWLSAKFLNKVTLGASTKPAGGISLVPNANPATGGAAPQTGGLAA